MQTVTIENVNNGTIRNQMESTALGRNVTIHAEKRVVSKFSPPVLKEKPVLKKPGFFPSRAMHKGGEAVLMDEVLDSVARRAFSFFPHIWHPICFGLPRGLGKFKQRFVF